MKTKNIKALFRFEGYIAKELNTDGSSVKVKIDFDGRIKPRCPHCHSILNRNKSGKGTAMDLPLGFANVVYKGLAKREWDKKSLHHTRKSVGKWLC